MRKTYRPHGTIARRQYDTMGPFYSTNQRYASSTAILRRRAIPPHIVPMSIIIANRNETDREPAAAHDLQVHVMSDVATAACSTTSATFNMIPRKILKDMIYNDPFQDKSRP